MSGLNGKLPAWEAWFDRQGVSRHDCVVLPTATDARSAAALLALMNLGQSMMLWRQPLTISGGRVLAGSLPGHCRFAMVESGEPLDRKRVPTDPEAFRLLPLDGSRSQEGDRASFVYLATSGTTGKPKIVVYSHRALQGNAASCRERLQVVAEDRVIIPVPLAHMYGLGAALLPAVQAGASIRLVAEANLVRYIEAEAEFGPTVSFLTPSFCHLLLKGRRLSRPYRLTVLAGDRVAERTFADNERRHGCTVALYGSTELGVIAAGSPLDSYVQRRDTAGQPLPGVELATEGHSACESFALRFRHPHACLGYADDQGTPVLPASLCEQGWFSTQDLGSLDEYGRIRLSGRVDHTVKRDGMLVAFADVEHVLQQLEGVDRVVVVPGGSTPRGRELVAVCTLTDGAQKDAGAMNRSARVRLPGHAVPDRFIFLDELPLTATAKPDRVALATLASILKEEAADARTA